ncbi:uncharacterized protein LOC144456242 [Phascolarctos cinereus]
MGPTRPRAPGAGRPPSGRDLGRPRELGLGVPRAPRGCQARPRGGPGARRPRPEGGPAQGPRHGARPQQPLTFPPSFRPTLTWPRGSRRARPESRPEPGARSGTSGYGPAAAAALRSQPGNGGRGTHGACATPPPHVPRRVFATTDGGRGAVQEGAPGDGPENPGGPPEGAGHQLACLKARRRKSFPERSSDRGSHESYQHRDLA